MGEYKKFLTKIYAFQFFGNLMFIYPLYALMFMDGGVSSFQISALFSVWALVVFVFEVPSGVWGDTYSRKNILVLSRIIKAVGFLVCVFRMSFRGFFICLFLWGISSALQSGTLEAFVYDEMLEYGKEESYTKVLGRLKMVMFIGLTLGGIGAMVKGYVSYEVILLMTIGALILSMVCMATIGSVKQRKSLSKESYLKTLVTGCRLVWNSTRIRNVIILLVVLGGTTALIDEYFPLYIKTFFTYPEWVYGFFYGCFVAVGGIASYLAHYFEKRSIKSVLLYIILVGVSLFYLGLNTTVVALGFLLVFEFFLIVSSILMESSIQKMIPSENRATIGSLSGFGMQCLSMIGYLVFGFFSLGERYDLGYMRFGLVVILLGIWGLRVFRNVK